MSNEEVVKILGKAKNESLVLKQESDIFQLVQRKPNGWRSVQNTDK